MRSTSRKKATGYGYLTMYIKSVGLIAEASKWLLMPLPRVYKNKIFTCVSLLFDDAWKLITCVSGELYLAT